MGMSEQERADYLASITPMIGRAADAAFKKVYGHTCRDGDFPPRRADIPHAERNGDSAHVPADSWQKIKADFPSLFGKADDTA